MLVDQGAAAGTVPGTPSSSAAAVEAGRRALFQELCEAVQAAKNKYIAGLHNLELPYAVANYPRPTY
jgi:hypothetical protein